MTQPTPRPDMAQFANLRDGGNLPKRPTLARYIIAALCFAIGMVLAAIVANHAYARAVDAIANPHIEGFDQ